MNSLLPILGGLQNGTNAIGEAGSAKEPLGPVIQDQANPSGYTFARAFFQVFREHEESSPLINQLPAVVSTPTQQDGVPHTILTQKDSLYLKTLIRPDVAERRLSESPADGLQTPPEVSVLPISDSDTLRDSGSSLSAKVFDVVFSDTNESVSEFEGSGFQSSGEQLASGYVRPDLARESEFFSKTPVPLPRVLESGLVPPQVYQGPPVKHNSLVLNGEGESLTRSFLSPVKEVLSGQEQVGRSVQEDEALKFPTLQRISNQPARSQNVLSNQTPHVTALQAGGPAGFTEPVPASQSSIKSIPGSPLVLNTLSGQVPEHRAVVPADLPGDTGLLGKEERIPTMLDTSVKNVGLDPSSGQGLGAGMNQSSHSQSGFQQPSSFPGQGMGLRALEERGAELPAPALQRLQMDVQLSENHRVQIDVGVQSKQVYAGLVMDHAVLRNLAAQFVPQLENQLARVDLELREFSAEVREEREQDADTLFHDSRFHEPQDAGGRSQDEVSSTQNPLNQHEEQGLHLVA